jgi:hypothetical protein
LCKNSSTLYGNSFSYTLVTEQDLRKHLDKWLFIVGSILNGENNNVPIQNYKEAVSWNH